MSSAIAYSAKYRSDIDGLRAVAVLAVLLFHGGMGVPGGYVGVDVFFVISGYLITSLILKDLDGDRFSIVEFWERRVRRILPALAVVVLCSLVAGWFLFLAYDFRMLGQSALAQSLLMSNVYFWRESGYFAQSAEVKPLLHTWSLAVEEQFYLLFPILLIAFKRFSRELLLGALLLLCAASLSLSIYCSYRYPLANFFLLPTRAWELLLGSFLAAAPMQRGVARWVMEVFSFAGLLAIFWAMFFYGRNTRFPGAAALLPCLGAALIIWANTHVLTAAGKLLSLRPIVFVGLVSYSLYLWHWPALVFSKYWSVDDIPLGKRMLVLGATVLVAILSWRFVETPFRRKRVFKQRSHIFALAAASSATFLLAGLAIYAMDGVPSRLPAAVRAIQVYTPEEIGRQFKGSDLTLTQVRNGDLIELGAGDKHESIALFVWGDSHGAAIKPVLDAMCREHSVRGVAATHLGWAPLLDYEAAGESGSRSFNAEVVEFIRRNRVREVLLLARWNSYIDADNGTARLRKSVEATLESLKDCGARVWIMRQVPAHGENQSKILVSAVLSGRDPEEFGLPLAEHRKASRSEGELFDGLSAPGIAIIDPTDVFVDGKDRCRVMNEGQALYLDGDHLTSQGSLMLRPLLEPIFQSISKSRASTVSKGVDRQ